MLRSAWFRQAEVEPAEFDRGQGGPRALGGPWCRRGVYVAQVALERVVGVDRRERGGDCVAHPAL